LKGRREAAFSDLHVLQRLRHGKLRPHSPETTLKMDPPTAAGAIGIPLSKLELLRRNAAFPSAISDDGMGNIVFDDAAVAVFAWLYRAAIGNGWLIDDAMLQSADFATTAATPAFAIPLVALDETPSDALNETPFDTTPLDELDLLE
jgi:hypothetical protein